MEHMEIWNQVCKTKPSDTKKITFGRSFTAICAQSQRKGATEVFGPFGIGWGVRNEFWDFKEVDDSVYCIYRAELFYKLKDEGCFPICSTVKFRYKSKKGIELDDEYAKKAQTDALTKGLSMLGFNSDVFEGKFDDNRYVKEMERAEQEEKEAADKEKRWKEFIANPDVQEFAKLGCVDLYDNIDRNDFLAKYQESKK